MEILEKLFGSSAKVKIMRLFLSNEDVSFENSDISKRAKVSVSSIKKELNSLNKIGLIKKKVFYKEIEKNIKKTKTKPAETKIIKKKLTGWVLNEKFPYLIPLQNLLVNMNTFASSSALKKLNNTGKLKLIVISGVFIQDPDSRVDLLVVGDKIKSGSLDNAIKILESEIGRELKYVVFETQDFKYRMNVYDKLVRDIMDYPHQKIINRLGL
jgi:predicted transcriptional regulator